MSKPVKNLIIQEYARRFGTVDGAVLVNMRGVDANKNNSFRAVLAQKGIRVTVVKNSLARKAAQGTALEGVDELLDGSIAMLLGEESVVNVARELLDRLKEYDQVEVRGAIMEGAVFKAEQVKDLSKYPTREEAIAKLAGALLGPGSTLAAALKGPGSTLAAAVKGPGGTIGALLKAIEQKHEAA